MANVITGSRIVLSAALLFVPPLSALSVSSELFCDTP